MQLLFNSCSDFELGTVRVDSCPPQLGKTGTGNCRFLLACPIDSFPCELYGSRLQMTPSKVKSHRLSFVTGMLNRQNNSDPYLQKFRRVLDNFRLVHLFGRSQNRGNCLNECLNKLFQCAHSSGHILLDCMP